MTQYIEVTDTGFRWERAPAPSAPGPNADGRHHRQHWFMSYGQFATNGGFFLGRSRRSLVRRVGADIIATAQWSVDAWAYMCCTYDGTRARLYKNGALVAGR